MGQPENLDGEILWGKKPLMDKNLKKIRSKTNTHVYVVREKKQQTTVFEQFTIKINTSLTFA